MQGISNDMKYAWRMLYKNPGFTAIAVLSLAFGIGANTSVFSVICAHLYGALPYAQSDKIIDLNPVNAQGEEDGASVRDYFAWRDQNHTRRKIRIKRPTEFLSRRTTFQRKYCAAYRLPKDGWIQ